MSNSILLKQKYDKLLVDNFETLTANLIRIGVENPTYRQPLTSADIEIVKIITEDYVGMINNIRTYIEKL